MFQGDLFSQQGWVDIPDGKLFWQPDFLSKEESAALFALLQNQLSWQQLPIKMFGREVLQPRLQAWFGNAYSYSGLTLSPAPLPNVLKEVKARSEKIAGIHFNSVLANYYRDGQDYMGWHQDNEAELGNEPVIASVSLGEARRFVLRHIRTQQKLEYVLNAGSLLIMAGKTQSYWQHAVPKTAKIKLRESISHSGILFSEPYSG